MKKIAIVILAAATIWTGCKPEIKGEMGVPFDKVKGLSGNWELSAFSQRDENNPIKQILDLSEFYITGVADPTRINFNADNRTYTVVPGPGRNYLGSAGTWRFDDPNYPSFLVLEAPTDTITLKLGTMPREIDPTIKLELPRFCVDATGNATPTVTYILTLNRIQ